jgi:RNA recognition motif-containing protein
MLTESHERLEWELLLGSCFGRDRDPYHAPGRGAKGQQTMRIYVGNMSFSTTEETLREAFEQHGAVDNVTIVTDRDTGRPRGFGFVEMGNNEEAQRAIDALNGTELDGRTLTVNEARPQERRGGGGGSFGRGGGGFAGGGGRGRGGGGRDRGRRDW